VYRTVLSAIVNPPESNVEVSTKPGQPQSVVPVRVCVNAATQPRRIRLDIPSYCRVIVPHVVLTEPRRGVVVLTGVTQVVGNFCLLPEEGQLVVITGMSSYRFAIQAYVLPRQTSATLGL
jgi:hypothetical protein